jgi:hypothetical protein
MLAVFVSTGKDAVDDAAADDDDNDDDDDDDDDATGTAPSLLHCFL